VKIEILRELKPEVEKCWLEKWNAWPTGHVFNHPRWFRVIQEALPHRGSLLIRAVSKNRDLVFMAAEQIERGLQLAGAPYLDKASILCDPELSPDEWHQFVLALLERFDWLCFQELSPTISQAADIELKRAWAARKYSSANPWFFIDSPSVSPKQRHELRRFTRLLEKQAPVEFVLKKLAPDDLEIMTAIERGSTKVDRRKAVLDNDDFRAWIRAFIKHFNENCWLSLLLLNGEPIAHYAGVAYKSRLLGFHMAFLKEYARFSPGSVLVFNILPLLRVHGFKEFDYGRGHSVMKRRFAGDNNMAQWNLYYFKKDWRGIAKRVRTEITWGLIGVGRLLRTVGGRRITPILDRLAVRR